MTGGPGVIFNSLAYALFLPAVVVTYWQLGQRARLWLLLVASYVFYGSWDWRFLVLIWISTIVDFAVGRALFRTDEERRRRWLLAASLAVNLGILGFFKYFGFFVDSAERLLGSVGFDVSGPTLELVLPVGISFYTFQTISYSFDCFRRRIEPTNDPLLFGVYVAFFPQLVAGPIERARRLLPQLASLPDHADRAQVVSGLHLLLLGLVKKVVIADTLAQYVDTAFSGAATEGWVTLLVGVYGFSLQIYGDFSGYTDMARGSAKLLGVDLMENFREPYLSRDIREFWRRWHISLSTWLRDYLYIPLGGNRGGSVTTYRNLMLTMLLGGLWHGAAWTFVIWGGLHGILLAANRARSLPERTDDALTLADLPRVLVTFHMAVTTFVVFRAESMTQLLDVAAGIASLRPGPVDADAVTSLLVLAAGSVLIDAHRRRLLRLPPIAAWRPAIRGVTYGVVAVAMVVASGGISPPFIYFQF